MSRVELRGTVALVTGAGSGIGAATAERLAEEGCLLAAVDIDAESGARTAASIAERGGQGRAFTCDVGDAAAVAALAEEVTSALGPVGVLVNNAGVGVAGPLLETPLEDWEWVRSVNLDGVVHGCHAFAPGMVARGTGQIVNVASGAAYTLNKDMAAYSATKAGVVMLSRCLRSELAPAGVGVSAICPGVIATPIASRTRFSGQLKAKAARAERLLGHGHPPRTVAKAIVKAIRRDSALVPVGIESHLSYRLLRLAPERVQRLVGDRGIPVK